MELEIFLGGLVMRLERKRLKKREENFSYFSWFVHDLLQHLTKILCLAPSTFLFRLFLGFGPIFVLLFGSLFEHRFLCALFLKNSFLLICGGYCQTFLWKVGKTPYFNLVKVDCSNCGWIGTVFWVKMFRKQLFLS